MTDQTKPKNDGGPAFPQSETRNGNTVYAEHGEGGMSLRDYFAAKAMQAFISNEQWMRNVMSNKTKTEEGDIIISKIAYKIADAMLKEMEK